jgi:hypothetical protein
VPRFVDVGDPVAVGVEVAVARGPVAVGVRRGLVRVADAVAVDVEVQVVRDAVAVEVRRGLVFRRDAVAVVVRVDIVDARVAVRVAERVVRRGRVRVRRLERVRRPLVWLRPWPASTTSKTPSPSASRSR